MHNLCFRGRLIDHRFHVCWQLEMSTEWDTRAAENGNPVGI